MEGAGRDVKARVCVQKRDGAVLELAVGWGGREGGAKPVDLTAFKTLAPWLQTLLPQADDSSSSANFERLVVRRLFAACDTAGAGAIGWEDFLAGWQRSNAGFPEELIVEIWNGLTDSDVKKRLRENDFVDW